MKVTNINGTSDNTTCKCDSWLKHWENFSGQKLPAYCAEKSCLNKPEHGAHVQKESSTDNSWYIVPLCAKCNGKHGETIEISDSIKLVSANVSLTCGKKG
jgi:hypothetical protein